MTSHATGTVILTLGVLAHLLSNEKLVDEFAFMRFAKREWNGKNNKGGCKGCGRRRVSRTVQQHILNTVKAHLSSLGPSRKERFKELSGIRNIVVHSVNRSGEQKVDHI